MEIFLESSLDWVSCIHVLMQIAGVSDQCRRIQEFYKAEVKAFKSRNSYKTWHEITRLSAPTQISHILLKVWLCWSLLRAVWWTLDTCSVDSRRPYPGVVHCRAHHAVQDLFLLGPATKLLFSRGRGDAWHMTADTWHVTQSAFLPPVPRWVAARMTAVVKDVTNNWWSSGREAILP